MNRVLFLYPTSRDALIVRVREGTDADTALWGMNHMPGAEQMTTPRFPAVLLALSKLLSYDAIFAQDDFVLGHLISFLGHFSRHKTKWIFINMTASTLIKRNARRPLHRMLLKHLWSSFHRIVCLSRTQLEDLACLGVPREHLVFVPFGVDVAFFGRGGFVQEEPIVVSGGRDAGRDYSTLFEAVRMLTVPVEIFAGHKNIPTDMNVPPNVSVRYDCPTSETRELYKRAAVVAVMSKDEGIPAGSDCSGQIVVLDALAAGKAVVATRRSWMADYFVEGEDLVIVEPGDAKALAEVIQSLLSDPVRRSQIVTSGHEKVVSTYTSAQFANALEALI